jgi:decaprenylphospho-beta-D-ribofuranose 2-oxidase
MSVIELTRRAPVIPAERSLSGWGHTRFSRSRVYRARSAEDVLELLGAQQPGGAGVIARGAGRSYGDAAQNDGGDVLDTTGMRRILSIDAERRLISAEAGATIAELMGALAAHGLTLPVVPGTRQVTLAGAIASDIHGKNHHRDGGLARHVAELTLCTPAGERLELSPESDAELFYATLGGMGLTGVVVQATLRADPLSPWVAADIDRTEGLEQTLELLAGGESHRYSVAWLDLLAAGSKMGRGIISRADPLAQGAGPRLPRRLARRQQRSPYPGALLRGPRVDVPQRLPGGLLRPSSVRAFNALYWRASARSERGRPLEVAPFFFPLDALGEWSRLYGHGGLIQYQFVIPAGEEATLRRCFELIRVRRLPVYLAVFKRFGAAFGGPLSFPLEGWTLAADLPAAAPGLAHALEDLDELVAGCGGRVYLSKDARLRPERLRAMYPQLERFREVRSRVDPEGVLRSDLALRLELCGAAT